MEQRPPLIQADKPGLVYFIITLAFLTGFAWGGLFGWWMLGMPT